MQRVETKEHSGLSGAEALGGSLEAARVHKVESPSLARGLGGGGVDKSEERVVDVRSVASAAAEAGLAVLNRTLHFVHFVRPITLKLDHLKVKVRQVGAETCCTLDGDVLSSIVGDLEASRNCVVLREYRVGQSSRHIRVVVVELDDDGRNVGIVAIRRWETGEARLAIHHFVGLVAELGDGVTVRMANVNGWQTEIASSKVWELPANNSQVVHPTLRRNPGRVDEVFDRATKVIADKLAGILVDVEKVRDTIAVQGEVGAIGGNG